MPDGLESLRFRIAGVGSALPSQTVTNPMLSEELGVAEDWILSRCGIETRHRCGEGESTLSLGVAAAERALAQSPDPPPDFLICSTFTPEYLLCPTAPAIATALGLPPAGAFDLNAACTGAAQGFLTALNFLATGFARRVMVVCSDTATKFIAPTDTHCRILFSDGAAALLVDREGPCRSRLLSWQAGSDGSGMKHYHVPSGGSARPMQTESEESAITTIKMEGRALFRFATEKGTELIDSLLEKASVAADKVRWVILHQANLRIIQALQQRVAIPADRWVVNIQGVGNTVAASIPLALSECMERKAFSPGDLILVLGFGAGLTWAGFLMEW